jgi:hypothetical protein
MTPREVIAGGRRYSKGWHGLKPVGSFLPRLTAKAFERYGFSATTLVTDWSAIVGPELAAYTAPERLKWQRAHDPGDETDAKESRRQAATLVLRADPARALDVQYRAGQVMERINAYFGYAAVGQLRILQAPINVRERLPAPPRRPSAGAPAIVEVPGIADLALRNALGRLGAGIRASR